MRVGDLVLDRYRIVSLIGEGAMAKVYFADDEIVGQQVAVKLLHLRAEMPEAQLRRMVNRFAHEAEAIKVIQSPYVLRLFDTGWTAEGPFMVLEYLDGYDLAEVLAAEGSMEPAEIRTLGAHLARALVAAHERQITHRDIKPANIMLRHTQMGRQAVLADFGIALVRRSVDGTTLQRLTQEGQIVGTPRYMAPETLRDQESTARSDIYSLGVVLFEMLAGEPANHGDSIEEVLEALVQGRSFRLPRAAAARDPELADLIHEMITPQPEGRPGSADEVLARLDSAAMAFERAATLRKPVVSKTWLSDMIWLPVTVLILVAATAFIYVALWSDGGLLERDGDASLVDWLTEAYSVEETEEPAIVSRDYYSASDAASYRVQSAVIEAEFDAKKAAK